MPTVPTPRKPRMRRPARAIVSVGVALPEFEMLDQAAIARGVHLSTFMREASIRAARRVLRQTDDAADAAA